MVLCASFHLVGSGGHLGGADTSSVSFRVASIC